MAEKPTYEELEQKVRALEKAAVEQRSLEHALRESQERLSLAIDGADLGMWDWKVQTGEVHFSERWAEILGYSHHEIKPHVNGWEDLLHPEDVPSVMETLNANLKGRSPFYECEHRLRTKSGEWRWVLARGKVIERDEEGKPLRHAGTHMDINQRMEIKKKLEDTLDELEQRIGERTSELEKINEELKIEVEERKKAEKAIIQGKEDWKETFNALTDLIAIVDGNFKIVRANKAMAERLGMTPDEVIGLTCYEELHGTKEPPSYCPHVILLEDGREHWAEVREERLNGHFIVTVSPVHRIHGLQEGSIHVARDITEQKRAEKEKENLQVHLQRVQRLEAIGTLAGGVAHDFNNLLMGIQGRTSLMREELDPSDRFYDHLIKMEEYVESAADLARKILGFASGGEYKVIPTDLNGLLNKSSKLFGRAKKEIAIHKKFQKEIWTVDVDRVQIEQVFLNLYVNASHAMPERGDLHLETENVILDEKHVKPFALNPGRYVRISVTDTGVGMDQKVRDRVFEPFFTTKKMGTGTGLGLASAYWIIKRHGGMINVYSEKGKGTTFNIYLPASDKQVVDGERLPHEVLRGHETILLVDDEQIILDVGKEILEELGYRVFEAKNGREAINLYKIKSDEIDLVILDMIMPHMTGGEIFDRMKQINPEITVLLSSGYSINGEAQAILDRGCRGFIQKPFDMRSLSKMIRNILNSK